MGRPVEGYVWTGSPAKGDGFPDAWKPHPPAKPVLEYLNWDLWPRPLRQNKDKALKPSFAALGLPTSSSAQASQRQPGRAMAVIRRFTFPDTAALLRIRTLDDSGQLCPVGFLLLDNDCAINCE
jgi:hypothetical protein